MNISDLLASLASGKGLNITPGNPAMDITQLVSQIGQGGPQAPMPMAPALSPPQPQALPGAPVAAMNLGGQPNDAQTGGGYMNLGSGLAANLPKSPLPPPETEPTAPKSTSPITTGSIAPSTPAPSALGATTAPDFSHSFGEGLINVGNALQGKSVTDLGADTLEKNATYAALVKKGVDPTTAEALVRNPTLMTAAVPRIFGGGKYGKQGTVFRDANGDFYTAQFAEDGTRLITPLTTGAAAGTPAPTLPGQTGGAAASPGGIKLTPSRGVEVVGNKLRDKATGDIVGDVSSDLQGGKFSQKTGELKAEGANNLPKAQIALGQYEIQNKAVNDSIDKAIDQANGWTTGFIGDWTKSIAGTPAHNLRNTLDSVRSNLGFDKLQDMRANSPTGGALGQVSENENILLQSVWGSIQQSQTKEQLIENLNKIKTIREQYRVLKEQAYQMDVQRFGADKVPDPVTGQLPKQSAPAAAPKNAPQQSKAPAVDPASALSQARAAIKAGKDPAAIKARLQQLGIDPAGL